jgi:hypothetical protein
MSITASVGAQVTITNNGASNVAADCAIAEPEPELTYNFPAG